MAQGKPATTAVVTAPSAPAEPPARPWPAYTVERKPLAWLKPYAKNARTHSKDQIEQIRGSLKQFGWTVPVLAREDGTIIAGHGRVEAAKLEGITEAPVIIATGWTEEQCRAYALADNRIALNSGWDEGLLGVELQELKVAGLDLALLGFEPAELDEFLGPNGGGLTDPDDVPEEPAQPVTRLGDLWLLGRHRLLCGDATKAEDVARVLGDVKPHLMVTDPPYGVNYDPAWRTKLATQKPGTSLGAVTNDDRCDWREAWKLFRGSVAYVWHGGLHASVAQDSIESSGFKVRSQIIWVKQGFVFGRSDYHWQHEPCWYAVRGNGSWSADRKQTTIWEIQNLNRIKGGNKDEELTGHSTQKPIECIMPIGLTHTGTRC